MRAALAFVLAVGVVSACGDAALKREGASCVSSSECDQGLLCDLHQPMPVCAGSGSTPPGVDAGADAHPLIDGGPHADAPHADAPAIDAPAIDAPAIDAPPVDAV